MISAKDNAPIWYSPFSVIKLALLVLFLRYNYICRFLSRLGANMVLPEMLASREEDYFSIYGFRSSLR